MVTLRGMAEHRFNNVHNCRQKMNWDGFVWSGSDLVAKEIRFGLGWNSPSPTAAIPHSSNQDELDNLNLASSTLFSYVVQPHFYKFIFGESHF